MRRYVLSLACSLAVLASPALAQDALNGVQTAPKGVSLHVQGQAQLNVANDLAVVYLRINQRHRLADQARAQANRLTEQALKQIKAALHGAQIQTAHLSCYPIYAEQKNQRDRIEAWQASQTLQIKTDALNELAVLLTTLPQEVGIESIQFELKESTRSHWDQELTRMAIADATDKARYAAQAMGQGADRVQLHAISFGDKNTYPHRVGALKSFAGADNHSATPIEAGHSRLTLNVDAQLLMVPKKH